MISLSEGEKVVYEIRRHWFVLFTNSFFLVLFFIVPWIVIFGINAFDIKLLHGEGSLIFFLSTLWLFVTWITFVIIWTNYYLDVWIITNRRIIDIEQFSLFKRDVSEFRLDRIQDVTIEVKGVIPTLLHFGDIHVETAGESRRFVIKSAPNPYKIRDFLVKEHDREAVESRGHSIHT